VKLPPPDLPSVLVASGEALAHRFGIAPADFWAYLYRRKAPPSEVRAALVEALFPLVKPADFLLTSHDSRSTLHTMHTSDIAEPRTGRPSKLRKHPLIAALAKRGVSVAEEAKTVRRSVASLRSFCFPATSEHYRPIPRAIAERWLAEYKVPLATWPRIAD
jgi:lambda repressor-like predicted transcriptional regulator